MRTVNIREAKAHLSRLVDDAAKGEAFIIARAGKPLVKVTAVDTAERKARFDFMAVELSVPDDFDDLGQAEIEAMFDGATSKRTP